MSYATKIGQTDPLPPVRTLPEYRERRIKLKSCPSKYSEKSLRCLDDIKLPSDKLQKPWSSEEEKKPDAKDPAAITPPLCTPSLIPAHQPTIFNSRTFQAHHIVDEKKSEIKAALSGIIRNESTNESYGASRAEIIGGASNPKYPRLIVDASQIDIASDAGMVEKAVYPGFDKASIPSEKPPIRFMAEAVRKHKHLTIFPDIIGYSVLLGLKECHQNSVDSFNKDFQAKLCDIIFQLLSGIPPSISPSWPVEEEEPTVVKEKFTDENRFGAILISDRFTDDDIIKYQEEKSKGSLKKIVVRKEKKIASSVFGLKNKSRMLDFNIFQNSPVIKNYLKNCGSDWEPKKITISRREMVNDAPTPDQQTYRQILHDSYRTSKNHILKYKVNLEEIIKERNRIAHDSAIQINYEQDKLAKILMNPDSIKSTADHILDIHTSRAKYNLSKQNEMPFIRVPLVE
ncbi:hypothetical protein HDV01_005747 [Terramyces sp. JEL0728]|nr:hypothetical protein HDV01_005747 [Terramyces sp. JEL0728]